VSNYGDLGSNLITVEEYLERLPQTINVCAVILKIDFFLNSVENEIWECDGNSF
jgi:hypothetical protein